MKLTKDQKKNKSKELAKVLKGSAHIYFTQYQGLKFKDMDDLRGKLRVLGSSYKVYKNSVLVHALKEAGITLEGGAQELLSGPNAVLVGAADDPVSPARVLLKFAKEFEALKVKGGYVDGRWLSPAECKQLSTLGTKPEVLGKLANVLYSAVAQSAWVLAAPIRDLSLVLQALEKKKKSEAAA